jgi:4-amino-4-deoxy-L-arabinose transferase-like glycosyltransferase
MIQLLSSWTKLPHWFWPVLIGVNFLLHIPFFQLPPVSAHVWRQSDTMAVARNFYEEGMNILEPRVDSRYATTGITGMQFPSYEWLVASSYHVFGFHEVLPRLINWLIYMAGIVVFYHLVRLISGRSWLGGVGAWCMAWSPDFYYHGANALPDVLALTASMAGLLWFVQWRAKRKGLLLFLSLLAVTLGGLTKLQYQIVGFPIAFFVVRDLLQRRYSWRELLQLVTYAIVSVGVSLSWYAYALHLMDTSGLSNFGLEMRPALDVATGLRIVKRNLLSDWPEVFLGYGAVILLVVGLWRFLRRSPTQHAWFGPGLTWGLALIAYYIIELSQMRGHTYYMFPLLPVLLLVAVWGVAWLARFPKAKPLVLILLIIQPVWAYTRVNYTRLQRQDLDVAAELLNPATRATLEQATPPGALCVVGPDPSSCIDFYFLHKKGFPFAGSSQLLDTTATGRLRLADFVARGARYLYTNDSLIVKDPQIQLYLEKHVKQVGDFGVWKLRGHP